MGDLKVSTGLNTLLLSLHVFVWFLFENEYVCMTFLMLMIKFIFCSIYSPHVNVWALIKVSWDPCSTGDATEFEN